MKPRVLITFLGVGKKKTESDSQTSYETASYSIDGKAVIANFFGHALDQVFQYDKIFVFGTPTSMWDVLESTLQQQNVKRVNLVAGQTKEDLFHNTELFFQSLEKIQEPSEVDVDITHSFRSLPIFFLSYLKFYEAVSEGKLTLRNVFYGMFENKNPGSGLVPVVNLDSFYQFQDWAFAANALQKFLNPFPTLELLEKVPGDSEFKSLWRDFSYNLELNRTETWRSKLSQLIAISQGQTQRNNPGSLYLPKVLRSLQEDWGTNKSVKYAEFHLAWKYYQTKNYAKSLLLLSEAILSYFIEKIYPGLKPENETMENQTVAKNFAHYATTGKFKTKNKTEQANLETILNQQFKKRFPPEFKDLGEALETINNPRNIVAHWQAKIPKTTPSAFAALETLETEIRRIGKLFETLRPYFTK